MDENYRDYFSKRLLELEGESRRAAPRRRLGRGTDDELDRIAEDAARQAVVAASSELLASGKKLREDGELVIYLLARELVARPVATVRRAERSDIPVTLREDAATIARHAGELAATEPEVSAHRVIDALAGVWSDLGSGRFNLWDRRRGNTQ